MMESLFINVTAFAMTMLVLGTLAVILLLAAVLGGVIMEYKNSRDHDAYRGAREDLLYWRRRAQMAEDRLCQLGESLGAPE